MLICNLRYTEAIDILFATNGFHFNHRSPLFRNLPRLILPNRLANIQKLELVWEILPCKPFFAHAFEGVVPINPAKFDNERLRWICDKLPEMFPGLKELHLSLLGTIKAPEYQDVVRYDTVLATERAILAPVEAMLSRMPKLFERVQCARPEDSGGNNALNIAFNCHSFWQAMLWTHNNLGMPGLRAVTDEMTASGKFWKQLGESGGYWVCSSGIVDEDPGYVECSFCSWGFRADDFKPDGPRGPIWYGLECPHELWYDDYDPANLTPGQQYFHDLPDPRTRPRRVVNT